MAMLTFITKILTINTKQKITPIYLKKGKIEIFNVSTFFLVNIDEINFKKYLYI